MRFPDAAHREGLEQPRLLPLPGLIEKIAGFSKPVTESGICFAGKKNRAICRLHFTGKDDAFLTSRKTNPTPCVGHSPDVIPFRPTGFSLLSSLSGGYRPAADDSVNNWQTWLERNLDRHGKRAEPRGSHPVFASGTLGGASCRFGNPFSSLFFPPDFVRFRTVLSGDRIFSGTPASVNASGKTAPAGLAGPALRSARFLFPESVSAKRVPFAEAACRERLRNAVHPQAGGNPVQGRSPSSFPAPFFFFSDGGSAAAAGSFPESVSAGVFPASGS